MRNINIQGWHKNLYSIWIAELFGATAFQCFYPFVAYYIGELGVNGESKIVMWSGIIVASSGISLALFSPFWGYLADRYGRKLMLLRAMFGGAVCVTMMAFAKNVYQLFFFRILQGVFAGTTGASMALVSTVVPESSLGFSFSLLYTTIYLGLSIGPLVGGAIADYFGYRTTLMFAGGLLFVGGLVVLGLVKEDFRPDLGKENNSLNKINDGFKIVRSSSQLLVIICLMFFAQYTNMAIIPILPIYIQTLLKSTEHLVFKSGGIMAITGFISAISGMMWGKLSDTRGKEKILVFIILSAGLAYFFQAIAINIAQLIVTRILLGIFIGGIEPIANAMAVSFIPKKDRGKVYGVISSTRYFGNVAGAISGGLIASLLGLRATIIFVSVIFILMGLWIYLRLVKN